MNEYKFEIERLNGELDATKKKYFEFKRKELADKEKKKTSTGGQSLSVNQHAKIVGGGYNMTTPVASGGV